MTSGCKDWSISYRMDPRSISYRKDPESISYRKDPGSVFTGWIPDQHENDWILRIEIKGGKGKKKKFTFPHIPPRHSIGLITGLRHRPRFTDQTHPSSPASAPPPSRHAWQSWSAWQGDGQDRGGDVSPMTIWVLFAWIDS